MQKLQLLLHQLNILKDCYCHFNWYVLHHKIRKLFFG